MDEHGYSTRAFVDVLVRGMVGVGKTAFLRHLMAWWQNTGFVTRTFYAPMNPGVPFQLEEALRLWARGVLPERRFDEIVSEGKPFLEHWGEMAEQMRERCHVVVFDGIEWVEDEPERQQLKAMIASLARGRTIVLIGS